MALSATVLGAEMKTALDTAFGALDTEGDANRKQTCDLLAKTVVDHFTANGVISTDVTGSTADGVAVTGTGTGTIS